MGFFLEMPLLLTGFFLGMQRPLRKVAEMR